MSLSDGSENKTDTKVNRGLAWTGLASSAVGFLDIIAYVVVLAFWVTPAEFGVAMIAIALFPALDLATDLGLYAAVVQKDDHSPEKISTIFWLNLAISLLLWLGLATLLGPALAHIQGQPIVKDLLVVYGAKLVWQNTYFMPYALMEKELRFKELSVIRIVANIAEFAAKIGLAATGFGIWCFVIAPFARVLITSIGIQHCRPWRPQFVLQIASAWHWLKFGLASSAHRILFHLYTNADYQVVAHYFGDTANGLYSLAYKIVLEPAQITADVVNKVAFPTFAKFKNDTGAIVSQLRKFLKVNLVLTCSFLVVVGVTANDLIAVFWGEEWVNAAPFVQVLCGVAFLRSLSLLLPPVLDGVGKPSLSLLYTVVAASVVTTGFFVYAEIFGETVGPLSVALAWMTLYPIAFFVLVWITIREIRTSTQELSRGIWRIPIWALVALGIAAAVEHFTPELHPTYRLVAVAAMGLGTFTLLLSRLEGISLRSVKRELQ